MQPSPEDWAASCEAQRTYLVYLIGCRSGSEAYVKIGRTSSLRRRLSNIQTGCPHPIDAAFVITSEYQEEVVGLERLLHLRLRPHRLRAEWYLASPTFLRTLDMLLKKINEGGFSYDEIRTMPDFCGPELEIMLHAHDFIFSKLAVPFRPSILDGARPLSWKRLTKELTKCGEPAATAPLLRR